MNQEYQSFPGKPGASDSGALLAALAMPPLAGRRFLDMGCNEGYFCGYAFFDAATRIVGVDNDAEAIARGRRRFPNCEFMESGWDEFLHNCKEKFDVILCAAALRHVENPRAFMAGLMRLLGAGGVLILQTAVLENAHGQCEPDREGRFRLTAMPGAGLFGDMPWLEKLLEPYAYKHMGPCTEACGAPLAGHVFHVRNPLPCAILLMGAPGSGKSSTARKLFPHLPIINGDMLLARAEYAKEKYPRIAGLMAQKISWQRLDLVIREIFDSGSLEEYVEMILEAAKGRDFIFDGFIPEEEHARFTAALEAGHCRILTLHTPPPPFSMHELSRRGRIEARKYQLFLGAYENVRKRGA